MGELINPLYWKAKRLALEAAVDYVHSNYQYKPENPYKHPAYAREWKAHFEQSVANLEKAILELDTVLKIRMGG